jgi:hypothetical protein
MRWTGFGRLSRCFAAGLIAVGCAAVAWPTRAQGPQPAPAGQTYASETTGGPNESSQVGSVASIPASGQYPSTPAVAEHPLVPALRMAYSGMDNINKNIQDYTCLLVKRERIDGKLGEHQYMAVKIRNHPFSVYLSFLKPEEVAGREVIYVEGANKNELQAHEGHGIRARLGTFSFNPTSAIAMEGNRYPITQIGVANLTHRLIEVAEHDKKYGECEVQFRKGAKVNDRVCTIIEVTHPIPRRNFLFHKAVIYVDDQMNVPIRYEAYSWPKVPGGPPVLDEEYTYVNMKLNVGLTDADFDIHNPSYHFKESGH